MISLKPILSRKNRSIFSTQSMQLLTIFLSILSVTLFYFFLTEFYNDIKVAETLKYKRQILIASKSLERYPEISPQGNWLVYSKSVGSGDSLGMGLALRSLNDNGKLQITDGLHYDHQPTFSPDQSTIAFARITDYGDCEIRTISSIGGPDKRISGCLKGGVFSMLWSKDNRHLFFIDRNSATEQGRLNRINLKTLELDFFNIDGYGFDDLAISHNGKKLAVTLSPTIGIENIYHNIATR